MSHDRGRAWRRSRKRCATRLSQKTADIKNDWHGLRPKRWYEMYWRRNKLKRAQQIGLIWPPKEWKKLMADIEPLNILFVCSKNQWRSPTGEKVFADLPGITTRSAGTARSARRHISMEDIHWADVIFCMEDKHKQRLLADFRQSVSHKAIYVLDIPDDYQPMDPELIHLFEMKAAPLIEHHLQ